MIRPITLLFTWVYTTLIRPGPTRFLVISPISLYLRPTRRREKNQRRGRRRKGEMGIVKLCIFSIIFIFLLKSHYISAEFFKRDVIELEKGPEDVAWVVQLSDLHFSVHHPERALGFEKIVGPSLSMINPSLVFITGDLTGNNLLFFAQKFCYMIEFLFFFNLTVYLGLWGSLKSSF